MLARDLGLFLPKAAIDVDYSLNRCPTCTLEFAWPLVPGRELFYDALAAQEWYFPPVRWEWDVVLGEAQRKGTRTLLEVGCGSGIFLKRVLQHTKIRPLGLDLTPSVVAECRAQGLEVMEGTIERFREQQVASERIDCVVAFHCLEHVADPVGFVRSMTEVVAVGGSIYVSTPYSPLSYESLWPDPLNLPPHHMTRWNVKSYQVLAHQTGLQVRCFLPDAASIAGRVVRSFRLWGRTPSTQRTRAQALKKMVLSPRALWREFFIQKSRDRVNGRVAADVVLAEFTKA
jgi:2-polyprenyl-3-methyl-5-hydroxy-6-metoxy-1,4-benzoquinol methylase